MTKERKFEEVVKSAEQADVRLLTPALSSFEEEREKLIWPLFLQEDTQAAHQVGS